jgi:hypothetical protein
MQRQNIARHDCARACDDPPKTTRGGAENPKMIDSFFNSPKAKLN